MHQVLEAVEVAVVVEWPELVGVMMSLGRCPLEDLMRGMGRTRALAR